MSASGAGRGRPAGSSHSEYCGLHTLFSSRNPATSRKASWATRGRTGAASASQATPGDHSASRRRRRRALSTDGDCPSASGPSRIRWSVACRAMFQIVSGSAGRSRLSRRSGPVVRREQGDRHVHHRPGDHRGRDRRPPRSPAAPRAGRAGRGRRAAGAGRAWPRSPARAARRRARAATAPRPTCPNVARATANRSQFVKACTSSSGDSPIIAASQGRRPDSPRTPRTCSSAHTRQQQAGQHGVALHRRDVGQQAAGPAAPS